MPTLALYTPNPLADASHAVRAPGGYEWWYFDAEDPATDTQIVAIYLHGFIFHPGYLRAHAKYVRRPTKTAPPLPDDFACMYFCVYRGGKILTQIMAQVPPREYAAATDSVNGRIGPSTLSQSAALEDSPTPFQLHVEGHAVAVDVARPETLADKKLTADLTFTPTLPHPPIERRFLSREMTGADHHWVIAAPRCDVSGSVRIASNNQDGSAGETIDFTGVGYHDHNYGTAPLGPGLAKWIWGRAIVRQKTVTFHYAVPRDAKMRAESHFVIADASGVRELQTSPSLTFDRHTTLGLAYPSRAEWPGVMTLSNPRVIDASPFYLRLQYDADVTGERTTAFCEVAYPHRLRWPILGRMIEMSIDKRGLAPSPGTAGRGDQNRHLHV